MSGLARASEPAVDSDLHGWLQRLSELMSWEFGVGGTTLTVGAVSGALLSLVLIVLLGLWIRSRVNRYADTREFSRRASLYTVGKLAFYLMIVVAVLISLAVLGIPISRFAVVAGALGVGLGFGLQAIFNNFVSGLILLFDRALKVGDFVELQSGIHGEVKDINIRATRIRTNDDVDILVPNSEFVSGRVTNWTYSDESRRMKLDFGVAYGVDKELVRTAGLEAAAAVPFTLSMDGPRAPTVRLMGFGDSSLNFELVVWVDSVATRHPSRALAAYFWALDDALRKHGIEIPFPQRDIRVRSLFGLQGEGALQALATPRHGATPADAGDAQDDSDAGKVPTTSTQETPEKQ